MKIITLCGSIRFEKLFKEYENEFALQGHLVLAPNLYTRELTTEQKIRIDKIHLKRIELSDEIFVINKDGYIGESTRNEIEHTKHMRKTIRYMEDVN